MIALLDVFSVGLEIIDVTEVSRVVIAVDVWSLVVVVEAALDDVDGRTVTFTVVVLAVDPGQRLSRRWPSSINPSSDSGFTLSPPHIAWTMEASFNKPLIHDAEHWLPFVKSDVEHPLIGVL